jgi:hypothetical protein
MRYSFILTLIVTAFLMRLALGMNQASPILHETVYMSRDCGGSGWYIDERDGNKLTLACADPDPPDSEFEGQE